MAFPRRREPEWMDDPQLDADLHRHALAGLRRINWWSRSGTAVWRAVKRVARRERLSELRILDLACGGGDIALKVARAAQRARLHVQITGYDFSPVAVAEAQRKAAACSGLAVEFQERDVLAGDLPSDFDIVMCSLFLHHLDEPQAVNLLRRMGQAARRLVLVDDLRRTRFGFYLAWCGCQLLTRSPVVHRDGPQSVVAAFTLAEARALATAAGLRVISLECHWPQRYLLSGSASE